MSKHNKVALSLFLLTSAVRADDSAAPVVSSVFAEDTSADVIAVPDASQTDTNTSMPVMDPIVDSLDSSTDVVVTTQETAIEDTSADVIAVPDASQTDTNTSTPVMDPTVDSLDSSTDVVVATQETAADQVNFILDMLQNMASSFDGDISVYQGICQDLQTLMDQFNNSTDKRRNFVDSILNFFTESQATIAQMQSNYDLLFALYGDAMFEKDSEIQGLQDTIKTMEEDAQQERVSMMDVIAQLNDNLSAVQSSYDIVSAATDISVLDLAQSVQEVSDAYNAMAQERAQFLSILDEIKTMAAVYFDSNTESQDDTIENQNQDDITSTDDTVDSSN